MAISIKAQRLVPSRFFVACRPFVTSSSPFSNQQPRSRLLTYWPRYHQPSYTAVKPRFLSSNSTTDNTINMSTQELFSVPIGDTKGTFVCTSPSPNVYVLTFNAPPDNRLLTNFCQAFLLALDIVEISYPPGVVVTTSAIPKFYSNGLDLDHAGNTEGFWSDSLFKLYARFLTYPMPTVALINGHAFAGGLMLAMYHDYRIFNPSRGFLCLNELDFGYPLKPAMSSIFRQKVPYPAVYRSMILEAKRFTAKEALEGGIVDILGGMEDIAGLIKERKLIEKGKSGIYGIMKGEMYRETLGYLLGHDAEEKRDKEIVAADEKRKSEAQVKVKEWEKKSGHKAKL